MGKQPANFCRNDFLKSKLTKTDFRFSPRRVISKELNTFSHKDEMLADPLSVHGIRGIYRMTTDYIGMENMPSFDEFAVHNQ